MNKSTLLAEIDSVFPAIAKPIGLELSFHKDDCFECGALREELLPYTESTLPEAGIREIYQFMSCLSGHGWRWALPSYLKHCLASDKPADNIATEFLVYNLGPSSEYEKDTLDCLSLLNEEQVSCLIHFLEWCSAQEHWAGYFPDHIEKAISFLSRIRGKLRAAQG